MWNRGILRSYYGLLWVTIEADENEANLFAWFSQRDRAEKKWTASKRMLRNSYLEHCHWGESISTESNTDKLRRLRKKKGRENWRQYFFQCSIAQIYRVEFGPPVFNQTEPTEFGPPVSLFVGPSWFDTPIWWTEADCLCLDRTAIEPPEFRSKLTL